MNTFTRTITPLGMTDTLVYEGKVYVKRYERDKHGYVGLDRSWEHEELPEHVIEAMEDGDQLVIMDALSGN